MKDYPSKQISEGKTVCVCKNSFTDDERLGPWLCLACKGKLSNG